MSLRWMLVIVNIVASSAATVYVLSFLQILNNELRKHLQVWLFEEADAEGERNAYVHHDIPLPAFPLAVAWMRFNPTGM